MSHLDPPAAPSITASEDAGLDGFANVLTRLTESPVRLAFDVTVKNDTVLTGILSEVVTDDAGDHRLVLLDVDTQHAVYEVPLADVVTMAYC